MDLEIEKQEDVTVFWDFSSTQSSSAAVTVSTYALVKNVCSVVSPYGSLKSIRVYWDHAGYPVQSATARIRSELSASGVYLIDCPAEGRKDGAMKKMLVDLLFHAWDHEAGPHTYVIISTDRDVGYALARLRMKEYRIILLSPSMTHSDLTEQANVHLDWTRSILGLTGSAYTNFEGIPATGHHPSSAAAGHQSHSSRLRRETLSSIYQESDEPPLPNPHDLPLGRQASSPFLPNTTRPHDIGSVGRGPAHPQTPPRTSAWSMPGDSHTPNSVSINPTPSGGGTAVFSGMPGVSSKPLNFSRETLRPPEFTFDPFNELDEWPDASASPSGKGKAKQMESATLSTQSDSPGSRFSFVKPQPLSTAPTSAEEERKPDDLKPQSPTVSSAAVDVGQTGGNAAVVPETSEARETPVQPLQKPVQSPKLPTPPPVLASVPTTTIPMATTAGPSSIPISTPQPPVSKPAVSPGVARVWNPLIKTLRKNGGTLTYTALPPKLLRTCPGAYGLAGRSKYKTYIQLAVELGIVDCIEDDPTCTCTCIQLAAAYM